MSSKIETLVESNSHATNGKVFNFGNGTYSAVMAELFRDARNFFPQYSEEQIERLAREFGSDYGRVQRLITGYKVGATNKDGFVSLKDTVATIKGVKETSALSIARIVSKFNDLCKIGVVYKNSTLALDTGSGDDADTSIGTWMDRPIVVIQPSKKELAAKS